MLPAGGAFFTWLLAGALGWFQWLAPLESMLSDAQFRLLRTYTVRPVANEVVIGFNAVTLGSHAIKEHSPVEVFDYDPVEPERQVAPIH